MGRHDVVPAVGQQVNFRYRRVRVGKHAHDCAGFRGGRVRRGAHFSRVRVQRGALLRHTLLQQQFRGTCERVGHESALHRPVEQDMLKGQQAHALMVRHEGTHDGVILAPRHTRWRVVDCLVEPIDAEETVSGERLQVATRFPRHHRQRQCAGVRRDDQVVSQPALEAQTGHAEGPILIDLVHIGGVIAGLGNTPGHSALPAVFDLARHRGLAGLIQQGVLVTRHDQPRHEVLEHRAAPRNQAHVAAMTGQQAAECEPMLLRYLSLRDEQKTGQARFGCQQVVAGRIAAPFAHVVADGQQAARRIVEKFKIHHRQFAATIHQIVDDPEPLHRASISGHCHHSSCPG